MFPVFTWTNKSYEWGRWANLYALSQNVSGSASGHYIGSHEGNIN